MAERVGMRCSKPGCRRPTNGPRLDPLKAVNLGVAAHITAASVGGPRFNPDLTSVQRSSAENGLWLCQVCAKLIDTDESRYPERTLRSWKVQAEEEQVKSLESSKWVTNDILLEKLDGLLNSISGSLDGGKSSESISYHVEGGSSPDHLNPQPDQIYSKTTQDGIVVNYMVRDGKLMSEIIYPGGKSIVADITSEGVSVQKLPLPLDQMTLEVDPNHILTQKSTILANGNIVTVQKGKWGLAITTVRSPDGSLISYKIEHGRISIPFPFEKIVIDGPDAS